MSTVKVTPNPDKMQRDGDHERVHRDEHHTAIVQSRLGVMSTVKITPNPNKVRYNGDHERFKRDEHCTVIVRFNEDNSCVTHLDKLVLYDYKFDFIWLEAIPGTVKKCTVKKSSDRIQHTYEAMFDACLYDPEPAFQHPSCPSTPFHGHHLFEEEPLLNYVHPEVYFDFMNKEEDWNPYEERVVCVHPELTYKLCANFPWKSQCYKPWSKDDCGKKRARFCIETTGNHFLTLHQLTNRCK